MPAKRPMAAAKPIALGLCALAALTAVALPAAAGFGMPEPLTPRGQVVSGLYDTIAILGVIVFLIVFAWLVIVILRFREGSGFGRATHEAERHNAKAEALWIGIPLLMVMWIGYAAYGGMVQLERGTNVHDADMEVKIVGSQWNWEARYEGNVSVFSNPDSSSGAVKDENVFIVPANKDILLNITSTDVIHAFYIRDANNAYVSMNDANPGGSNAFALQVVSFPPGNYSVQCKEMCFNPGHAYMRARFTAVPEGEFQSWLSEAQLKVGAKLVGTFDVVASGGKLTTAANLTVVKDTRAILEVRNQESSAVTLSGAGGKDVTIAAGASGLAAFDLSQVGANTVTASNGGKLVFDAVEAEAIKVDLGAFKLIPEHIELKAGKTYLVQVSNVHTTAHNLYFGKFAPDAGKQVVAHSATVNGGDSTAFVMTPTEDITEMWCDVPGHYGQGMHGGVTVSAA